MAKNLQEMIAALNAQRLAKKNLDQTPSSNANQLPLWGEVFRCLPNEIIRSALFSAKNRKQPRPFLKNQEIAVIGDGRITYSGEELRQDDQTLWLQLVHVAKEQALGQLVEFTPYSMCKAIGWGSSKADYVRLRACLSRMQATSLAVYSKRSKNGISMSMIPLFRWEDQDQNALKQYQVRLPPELVQLFADMQYTKLEWEQRLALPTGIATWLHGYFASHQEPFPIKLETIKIGSGITNKDNYETKRIIEKALDELVKVGFLKSWRITYDLVQVVRNNSTPKPPKTTLPTIVF